MTSMLRALYRLWRIRRNRNWLRDYVGVIRQKPKPDERDQLAKWNRLMREQRR